MAFLVATASYLPDKQVFNHDLTQFPARYRSLIADKAGILSRYHGADTECTSDLAARAVNRLLEKSGVQPSKVNALICATSSPDRMLPATAGRVQQLCGLTNAFAFDVNAVCSGAIYAMRLAAALIADGLENVIVVAADMYSKILNPKDITTYPYFGDGAGAVLIGREGAFSLDHFLLYTDGSGSDVIQVPGGGTMLPHARVTQEKDRYFAMRGTEVFDFACLRGTEVLLKLSRLAVSVPDRVIPHQANINIIKELATRTNWDEGRFFSNVDRCGNTAGASVLIALDECLATHPTDERIFLVAFGGGLAWGGCQLKR